MRLFRMEAQRPIHLFLAIRRLIELPLQPAPSNDTYESMADLGNRIEIVFIV